MSRSGTAFICVFAFAMSFGATPRERGVVRVGLPYSIGPGSRAVVLSVYAAAEGGEPLATETRSVFVEAGGAFKTPLGSLAVVLSSGAERWIAVRVADRPESRRVRLDAAGGREVIVHVAGAAIWANGMIHAAAEGFRFPDGTVQTTAATVTGGVPSVTGIAGAVTITGSGTASVGTAGNTITVTGTGLTGVTAGNGLTGGGSSGSPTLSASYGSPLTIGSTNAGGSATTLARSDHVHAHGSQSGGTTHSVATTGTAGFMSAADKTKLDALEPARTVVVRSGDTDAANGAALVAALNGITGNSATNPWLVKLEPGVYDLGFTALTMKSYVDIEGSGENTTFIKATRGDASATSTAAAVLGANAELRDLTITNNSAGGYGIGLMTSSGPTRLRYVTINSNAFTPYGIYASGGVQVIAIQLTLTATASGNGSPTGIYATTSASLAVSQSTIKAVSQGGSGTATALETNSASSIGTVDSSTLAATGSTAATNGIYVRFGDVTVTNSTVRAETASTRAVLKTDASASAKLKASHCMLLALTTGLNVNQLSASKGTGSTLLIATSMVDSASVGVPKCVHVYDDEMNDLSNVCPTS